jgi:hypothetical protein
MYLARAEKEKLVSYADWLAKEKEEDEKIVSAGEEYFRR